MHRRRIVVGWVVTVCALVIGLGGFLTSCREPAYNGRPLGFWLVELESVRTSTQRQATKVALGTILTNSPSSFASLVCAYESPVAVRARKLAKERFGIELQPSARRRRAIGMRVLEMMGDSAVPVVPDLVNRLAHRRSDVRGIAARALAIIGPGAQSAVSGLTIALVDKDEGVALGAVEALKAIGPPATRAALLELRTVAKDAKRPSEVRRNCIQAIAACGVSAAPAVSDLLTLSRSRVEVVRFSAVRALGKVGPNRNDLLPQVITALQDPALSVRDAALDSIEKMAPTTSEAIAALNQIANHDQTTRLRRKAVRVLDAINPL